MNEPSRNIRPVPTEDKVETPTESKTCSACKRKDRKIAELETQIDRLHRALQRESHHVDKDQRSVHDGKHYIDRNK